MTKDHEPHVPDSPAEGQPLPVDTGKGLSVVYNSRHLYSRYDPEKNILQAVRNAPLKPETLYLCISPVLGYGLEHLLDRISPDSFVLALECDESLMSFSAARLSRTIVNNPGFMYIRTASARRVLETIERLPRGPFRRCVRIDLSGGAALSGDFYAGVTSAVDEYISRYWKNHLTLMKLGRNYARNLFRNCRHLDKAHQIAGQSITGPIFVAGAGPSLETLIPFLRANRAELFILAVDAALPVLADAGIRADGAVLVESQFWIERAFSGLRDSGIPVYADLTSRPQAVLSTGGSVSFFLTEYTRTKFIERLRGANIAPVAIPPLGSVGLVALYLARLMAAPGVPIFSGGLDFSWNEGWTHARGAPPVRDALARSNRLTPPGSPPPGLSPGVSRMPGKNGKTVYSDPALSGYAALCAAEFSSDAAKDSSAQAELPILYSLATQGLADGLTPITPVEAENLIASCPVSQPRSGDFRTGAFADTGTKLFLEGERARLVRLKGILTGKSESARNEELDELVAELDYLWLHFPDGYRGATADTAFLKRVRIELEYFLKTIEKD